ncbi:MULTISPECIES: MAE_28990/MAE_18760 family HEPN-like nuclease [Acetobacteraceae]|uniref:MAE_28990/MAE_18760 family HEPN-like nuclease n=1 Tax=Acetobacteraceae TaxID=433 RepID=UPI0030A789C1
MADVRTLAHLQDALDKEMGWRLKEIAAFKVASNRNGHEKRFFIRAGIALVYAHWEGFIKTTSELYLQFVDNRGCTYQQLKSCFAVFGLKGKLSTLSSSFQAEKNIEVFDFIRSELSNTARLQLSSAINTESNLTSKVFSNIAKSLNMPIGNYTTKFNLIDESLVKRRNAIAHGEYLDIDQREFENLSDEIIKILREYKTDLLNSASQETYKC